MRVLLPIPVFSISQNDRGSIRPGSKGVSKVRTGKSKC